MMRYAAFLLLLLVMIAPAVLAQDDDERRYTGEIDEDTPSQDYQITLEAGQSVLISTEATSGDLDTTLTLRSPTGRWLTSNDDREEGTLDSMVGYTAAEDGLYTITVARFDMQDGYITSGEYELTITVGGDEVLDPLREIVLVALSGDEARIETAHFVIHYTVEGYDAATEIFARAVATTLEEVYEIEIERLGWDVPPSDGLRGGDNRIDVFLLDLLEDNSTGALGFTRWIDIVGDNPNTPAIETRAAASLIGLENDLSEVDADQIVEIMRSTVAPAFHHVIQLGYDFRDLHSWYYEASATYMEFALGKELDALRWTNYNFAYPEVCFGTDYTDPRGGAMRYGEWMFIQSLADAHGAEVVQKLWANIGIYEGFEALEETLARYGDTIPSALARYRVQNLLRAYDVGESFTSTIWMDQVIDAPGTWANTLDGVQELSANYFGLTLDAGTYQITLDSRDDLQVWVITVTGNQAAVVNLGAGGVVAAGVGDHQYVMVFNPDYDDDVNNCSYAEYELLIAPSDAAATGGAVAWDAANFTPPVLRE
jgi:hypothetical protein